MVHLIEQNLSTHKLCIFIDGLDEFIGNQASLITLIMKLTRSANIKICLSSRPYLRYEEQFSASSMLRLHDLTQVDIEHYVYSKLVSAINEHFDAVQTKYWLQEHVRCIAKQAEGVFLWVKLAVNNQLEGIYNNDSPQLLEQRLSVFPAELESVYAHMVDCIDRVYRDECALYLRMTLHFEVIYLRHLAFVAYPGLDNLFKLFPDHEPLDFQRLCKSTSRRIKAICKGFLEIQDAASNPPLSRVLFVHRTAAEFLRQTIVGTEFIGVPTPLDTHIQDLYIKTELATLIMLHNLPHDQPLPIRSADHKHDDKDYHDLTIGEYATGILVELSQWQGPTDRVYLALVEVVDRVLSSSDIWKRSIPTDHHWSNTFRFHENPCDPRSIVATIVPGEGDFAQDFVGAAASCGLGPHVLGKVDSFPALQQQQYKDYLLSCTLIGESWTEHTRRLELICGLLRRGASPNLRIGKTTSWIGFLIHLQEKFGSIGNNNGSPYDSGHGTFMRFFSPLVLSTKVDCGDELDDSSKYCDVLLAFLDSGIAINHAIPINMYRFPDPKFREERLCYSCIVFQLSLSPLAVVRQSLGWRGDVSTVDNAFSAHKAIDSTVFNSVNTTNARNLTRSNYELSAKQSDRLLEVCVPYIQTPGNGETMMELLLDEFELMHAELRRVKGTENEQQQQEQQTEDSTSSPDYSDSEASDEGSFHSANS